MHKTNAGQMMFLTLVQPYGAKPDMLQRTKNLNMFKHNLKKHYLKEIKNSNFRYLFILKIKVFNISPF